MNKKVNRSSKVAGVEVVKEPFEKTATQKIRRFKYRDGAASAASSENGKGIVSADARNASADAQGNGSGGNEA